MKAKQSISANKIIKGLTIDIKITGLKVLAIRLTVGMWLIKVGCWIIGCKLQLGQSWDERGKGQ